MTQHRYDLVGRISYAVSHQFTSSQVSLFASSGRYFGFFVRDRQTSRLILPVQPGRGFALSAENGMPIMAAFPARIGDSAGNWVNLYTECNITQLSDIPSTHMREALPNDSVRFDGLCLPGGWSESFVATPTGIDHHGRTFDHIEVAYRFPANPSVVYGVSSSMAAKGSPAPTGNQTGYSYLPDAHSFGVISLVDRAQVAHMLASDGIAGLLPTDDRHWSAAHLRDSGHSSRLIDINLGRIQH